jgi:hypothetical protein
VRAWNLAALVVIVGGAMWGCDNAAAPTAALTRAHFIGQEVAFDYPANWNAAHFQIASSHIQAIVFLSTESLSDPCRHSANAIECGSPVERLAENGVLVDWSHWDFMGWDLDTAKGESAQVDGRNAKVDWSSAVSQACARLGGGAEMVTSIEIPDAPGNWIEMRACVRGPAYDATKASLEAMIASADWGE